MTCYALVKKGYGTLDYIENLDTEKIMSILEYENIMSDIETLVYEDA